MDKGQFCQLGEEEKIALILLKGKLLARHSDAAVRRFLYQLDGLYICLCYTHDDQETLHEISVFTDIREVINRFRLAEAIQDPACRIPDMAGH